MVDFKKMRKETEKTHLFIPMSAMSEIRWLLDKAGVSSDECHMKTWRYVLNHQVPEIRHIDDNSRDAEIDRHYGENAKYVKCAPGVILSHYNVDDLKEALHDTLFGTGDPDYRSYRKAQQESEVEYDIEEGIYIMRE